LPEIDDFFNDLLMLRVSIEGAGRVEFRDALRETTVSQYPIIPYAAEQEKPGLFSGFFGRKKDESRR
jgi:hypothetical protein